MAERTSAETTVKKIDSRFSPHGEMGQQYLASGVHLALRKWDLEPSDAPVRTRRDYETVGYVIRGRAELDIEGQIVRLEAGDSWLVPRNAEHSYRILESFGAVEATSPPAQVHERDAIPRGADAKHESVPRYGRPEWSQRHHDPTATARPGAMRPLAEAAMDGGRRHRAHENPESEDPGDH
jgi:quercetin dioxygenase-like cupin family protein